MARTVKDIEQDMRTLCAEDKVALLRSLIAELDTPTDPDVGSAWLEAAQRRYRELVEGKVKGVPGTVVLERLRVQLGE